MSNIDTPEDLEKNKVYLIRTVRGPGKHQRWWIAAGEQGIIVARPYTRWQDVMYKWSKMYGKYGKVVFVEGCHRPSKAEMMAAQFNIGKLL